MKISDVSRSAMVDVLVDLLDAGASAGYLQVRTGSAPATTLTANSGTLLATLTFSRPAFGSGASGVATAAAITSDTVVDATGTPGHFRAFDSNNVCIMQGTAGDNLELDINGLVGGQLLAGGTLSISSMTVTVPAGT